MANIKSCKKWSITKWLFTVFFLLLLFQVFNIRSAKPAVPEIPTTPPPTPFYKTTEGIITMASACVVVLLAVVTVLLWRKHAKKRYDMKTPWHYTINCPISVDGSFPYGVTEDFIRIYKNMAVMLVILLTLGHCFPGFSSFFGILNNDRLGF